jgi:hypothetical protein
MRSDTPHNHHAFPRAYRGTGLGTRRNRLVLAGIILIVAAVAAGLHAPDQLGNRVAPRATAPFDLGSGVRTAEEQSYLDGLRPYLNVLLGEGRALRELGNSRSRNVFELSLRMDRYRTAASDIIQYVQDNAAPLRLAPFVSELQQQIDDSLRAIDASFDAFRTFDWHSLGESVSAFSITIDKIGRLAATPVAEQSP